MVLKRIILALGLLALLAAPAQAQSVTRQLVDKSSASVSTSVAATIMAANKARHYLFIQNIGTSNIWVSLTTTAAANTATSFKLAPGASLTFESVVVANNAVSIIAETATGKVTAYEG